MRKIIRILILSVFVLVLGGCGQGTTFTSKSNASIDDVCNYFPKELVEEAIGRPIVKVEGPGLMTDKVCNYYTDWQEGFYGGRLGGGPNIAVVVEEGLAAWKANKEKNGYLLEKDPSITMDHYIVRNSAKQIWQVTLILGTDKYLRIQANHSAVDGPGLIKIAAKFAEKIQKSK